MKKLLYFLTSLTLLCCNSSDQSGDSIGNYEEKNELTTSGSLLQGVPAYEKTNITYKRNGQPVLEIDLDAPVIIDSADKEQKWGYFQFPNVGRTTDGKLVAQWNMQADAASAYGMGGHGRSESFDGGKTWKPYGSQEDPAYGFQLKNGDLLKITTPKAIKVSELKLPKLIDSSRENYGRHFNYYRLHDLPKNLQGVYLARMPKGETKWVNEQAKLNDPQAARYTDDELFPVVWWGDMKTAADGSIIAGVYPGFLIGDDGRVKPSGVFFYRSTDEGRSWNIQGRIPYEPDLTLDSNGHKRTALGWTEPGFEILKDGSYLCIMRTTDGLGNSPMYYSRSTDQGVTWSKPKVFTKAGVLPRVLQLENGVIALAAGRPGMQLRFATDGKGELWTDPVEMLPYDINNVKDAVSCGYPEIIPSGPDKFLLIYSDFKYKNHKGEIRKAIKIREIKVKPIQ